MSARLDAAVDQATNTPRNAGSDAACYHCGETQFRRGRWTVPVEGDLRQFCCAGCQAVAQALGAAGLAALYARRTDAAPRPDPHSGAAATATADAATAGGFVRSLADGRREISLLIDGISCGACGSLCEAWIARQPGVCHAVVNDVSQRVVVSWNPDATDLAAVLRAISALGFAAVPYDPAQREARARRENRALLLRAAIAVLAMMQVMMFAGATYWSDDGVAPEQLRLLNWASMVLTMPVLFYSAAPFWRNAWRDVSHGRVGMDVPIVLGLLVALAASAWATLRGAGPVYYDSITMFVALVLGARYLELLARQRAAAAIEGLAQRQPDTAVRYCRWPGVAVEAVAAATLQRDDYLLVRPGSLVPADGEVVEGTSAVDEAMLTGEARGLVRGPGDVVLAGSLNRVQPLVVRVLRAGADTRLASILRLTERAAATRPAIARTADRIAAYFVAGLLVLAAITAIAWTGIDPARALAVTVAVLVVSCPCALALAMPAATAALTGALARRGVVFGRADALETLARVTHVVFDKTGTLTRGEVRLTDMQVADGCTRDAALALAAALEARSEHPLAGALATYATEATPIEVSALTTIRGHGIEGVVAAASIRIGTPEFVAAIAGPMPDALADFAGRVSSGATLVGLGGASGWCALFALADPLRADARVGVAHLNQLHVRTLILSGDRQSSVDAVAHALGIADARGQLTPEGKRDAIDALQRAGAVVAMVGDGINDAPALAQAQVSFSLASATPLAQWTADVVVLNDLIECVPATLAGARRALRILRQNFVWAIAYNALAIPAAAMGLISPLLAAVGMATSSLLVVGNALRLTVGSTPTPIPASMTYASVTPATEPEPAWKS
ncbi:MAG: heavy metal translocating P-type ATPase metal-binding domain-containing protein [Betaproteobacteria bacterium]